MKHSHIYTFAFTHKFHTLTFTVTPRGARLNSFFSCGRWTGRMVFVHHTSSINQKKWSIYIALETLYVRILLAISFRKCELGMCVILFRQFVHCIVWRCVAAWILRQEKAAWRNVYCFIRPPVCKRSRATRKIILLEPILQTLRTTWWGEFFLKFRFFGAAVYSVAIIHSASTVCIQTRFRCRRAHEAEARQWGRTLSRGRAELYDVPAG